MHAYIYTTYFNIDIHAYLSTYIHAYLHAYTPMHIWLHTYVHTYIYTYILMHKYTLMYIHMLAFLPSYKYINNDLCIQHIFISHSLVFVVLVVSLITWMLAAVGHQASLVLAPLPALLAEKAVYLTCCLASTSCPFGLFSSIPLIEFAAIMQFLPPELVS